MARKRATTRLVVDGMSCSNCGLLHREGGGCPRRRKPVCASAPISEVMVYHDVELVTREAICRAIRGAGRSPSW